MKKVNILIAISIFMLMNTATFALPLKLTDAEIQKLHQYFPVDDSPHFVWNGDPITVQLPLNKEKRIVFPAHVTFDAKGALTTDQLRIINNDKSLYLTAFKPINNIRIYVTLADTNEVVLMDLSTTDKANTSRVYVDIQQNNSNSSFSSSIINSDNLQTNSTNEKADSTSDNDNYVTLTRFAWQELYAPERLLDNSLNVTRTPMRTAAMLSTLVYGDKVYAHPIASWEYHNRYITAIELRNKYPHLTAININRDLCGHWQAAAIYPRARLQPAGDKTGDSATLFLISDKSFSDSMEVCNVHA